MFTETRSIWRYLKTVKKPIVMYGMGSGAEKILAVMESRGIRPDAFMASDEFVRGHSFKGYEVKKLSAIEDEYQDFILIVCFGTSRAEVLERLYRLAERYEVYAPDVPVYGGGLFDEKYVVENIEQIAEVRELFEDEQSRFVFDRLIDYRLSGNINILREITTPRAEAMALLGIKSDGSETFVDLGAYNGDTVSEFLELTGRSFGKIYAVEPDTRSFMKLRRTHYALGSAKFTAVNAAAWNEDGSIDFAERGGRHSSVGGIRTKKTEAVTVDTLCKERAPTLIKMDVEGCERQALLGAGETLRKHKPRMIVSVYHRTEDLLELPKLVKSLNGRYKLFLRHHEYVPAWDTNLYIV